MNRGLAGDDRGHDNEYATLHKLKLKILREGLRPHQCEECLNTQWNGVNIPLEIEHIDGDRWNNDMDNIKLLCPNCHALTETYCRKKNNGDVVESGRHA